MGEGKAVSMFIDMDETGSRDCSTAIAILHSDHHHEPIWMGFIISIRLTANFNASLSVSTHALIIPCNKTSCYANA
ncbi:hypothetical protein V6N12_035083 [Hibiscus sabdariffa]